MADCLKTQLKAEVGNSDLYKLGEMRVRFDAAGSLLIKGCDGDILKIISGAGRFGGGGDTFTLNGTTASVNGACVVSVPNKYKPTEINSDKGGFDVGLLEYSDLLTSITVTNAPAMVGDIGKLKMSVLRKIRLYGCANLSGDIAAIGNLSYVGATVEFNYSSGITGTIESLKNNLTISSLKIMGYKKLGGSINTMLEGMLNAGRTSDLYLEATGATGITFHYNDVTVSGDITFGGWTIQFTPDQTNKITINRSSGNPFVYDGNSWTFNP